VCLQELFCFFAGGGLLFFAVADDSFVFSLIRFCSAQQGRNATESTKVSSV
jgi:hypothetical protein